MLSLSRRDVFVALTSALLTGGLLAAAEPTRAILRSTAYDWQQQEARKTPVGALRQIVRSPTTTLDELEMHVTTLHAGQTSHAPHRHPNEELVILKEGTVEFLVQGEWKRLGPGSVIFNASNELHGLRNVGEGDATYHVINWRTPATPKDR